MGLAELLADGGEAAADQHFFRCPEFLAAEQVSHSLRVSDGDSTATLPVIVREIPGSEARDAISPYGYPGASQSGPPIDAGRIDWSATGLVSLFVRERVHGEPCFATPTERSPLLVSDPAQKRKSRMSDRQQIRRNEAAGYAVRVLSGPEAGEDDIAALHRVYTETMRAASATERYLFGREYFATMLSSPLSRLVTVDGPAGREDPAAAAIAVQSDGAIHYYLSGTAESHRRESPSKNLIVAVTELAEELGLPLCLGGGLEPGDSLEQFKRGFANAELAYRTHEIICDPNAYGELRPTEEPAGFFPAYRGSASEG